MGVTIPREFAAARFAMTSSAEHLNPSGSLLPVWVWMSKSGISLRGRGSPSYHGLISSSSYTLRPHAIRCLIPLLDGLWLGHELVGVPAVRPHPRRGRMGRGRRG